ncbi:hypothetical protein NC653_024510 [Populus alba x Populus x berolinensis]|uniref:Uncharacterized protein n=1 Tax=Populus alba x Populus x berolinensis TaxID=444605 RepID=A0AAD6M9J5_9ROSI|nr:hypothetical protein NC653_024510 [Populus alba x Populus x berolinensis]
MCGEKLPSIASSESSWCPLPQEEARDGCFSMDCHRVTNNRLSLFGGMVATCLDQLGGGRGRVQPTLGMGMDTSSPNPKLGMDTSNPQVNAHLGVGLGFGLARVQPKLGLGVDAFRPNLGLGVDAFSPTLAIKPFAKTKTVYGAWVCPRIGATKRQVALGCAQTPRSTWVMEKNLVILGLRQDPIVLSPSSYTQLNRSEVTSSIGSVCFGFGVCVRTQDSWVSTLDPIEWGLAKKPCWLGWAASLRVWPKRQGMTTQASGVRSLVCNPSPLQPGAFAIENGLPLR